ncbi:MAG: hypothetical protein KA170_01030 [Candidatus Promineofilum sp.]|nr:hypothetical protein [Promineifilum sp.]
MNILRATRYQTKTLAAVGLIALLGLMLLPGARAADFTAGTAAELAAAITAANAAGAGDHTITLTANIILTAPLPDLDNTLAGEIRLDGAGHTLDANGTGTALAILRGTTAAVENLTITGGAGNRGQDSHSGGGILNMGELSVSDATITGNTAAHGAGILNLGGETGNAALTLTRVTLSDNEASDTGGALANHGDTGTAAATLVDSTLDGNKATQYGGAISNNGHAGAANLTITNSTLSGNTANLGGAIFNNGNGGTATATLTRVTLSGNTGQDSGGAVFNNGNGGTATATLTNSTVSGNAGGNSGGGFTNSANGGTALVTLHFVTVAANNAKTGGGFYNSTGAAFNASATILAAGATGKACAFNSGTSLTSGGYNLDSDGSCGLAGTGDVSDGEAGLSPLAANAPGSNATHALGANSDAQRRIPNGAAGCGTAIATDQRGAARPNPAPLCDIGAYESDLTDGGATATPTATGTPPTPTATVTGTPPSPTPTATTTATATSTATATPTATATTPADCAPPYQPANEAELNRAIACINAAGTGTHSITLAADIELTAPTAALNNAAATEILLDGDGHTLDGDRRGTLLSVAADTTVRVRNVTLIGGQGSSGPTGDWAGGIYNQGHLTLENSSLTGNIAAQGGGIVNDGHGDGLEAELTIVGSTLTGNVATDTGGGLLNTAAAGGSATARLTNATLTGNYAANGGGGLYSIADGGNAASILSYTTLALNTATSGGGGIHVSSSGGGSTVALSASIVTNSAGAGPDCATTGGTILSTGYNLAGDGTCPLSQATDQPQADAKLLPRMLNAPGTTATHALGSGSAALDRIPSGAAGCGTTFATDQRGAARPYPAGGKCDIGAHENQSVTASLFRVYLPVMLGQ